VFVDPPLFAVIRVEPRAPHVDSFRVIKRIKMSSLCVVPQVPR